MMCDITNKYEWMNEKSRQIGLCQGQEKIEEGCKGMFLILCAHFFTDYQTRIT